MAVLSSWVDSNWFNVIQTVGILASLWMAVGAAHRDAKSREVENLLALNDQHRQLWSEVFQKAQLVRILKADANVLKSPPTLEESEFLNLVFVHFQTGWTVARTGALISLDELREDILDFFSLPLPRAVWEKTKRFRNQRFVRFVEQALKSA